MTKTFFRKRMRGLAEIERVAHEADASTDAAAVTQIAVAAIYRGIESLGVALYMRAGEGYERISSAGTLAFPNAYAFNEEPALRLRRWQEPFEIDDESDERHHMLFVPMMLRGDVLGFLCCGPKPDRTAYLPDEIAALSLLANHVAIAAAMLGRTPAPSSLALVGT
jgi:GAF domain-containing protein